MKVLENLIHRILSPEICERLHSMNLPLHTFAADHFLSLGAHTWPLESLARFWDLLFMEGSAAVFASFLALLQLYLPLDEPCSCVDTSDQVQAFMKSVANGVANDCDLILVKTWELLPLIPNSLLVILRAVDDCEGESSLIRDQDVLKGVAQELLEEAFSNLPKAPAASDETIINYHVTLNKSTYHCFLGMKLKVLKEELSILSLEDGLVKSHNDQAKLDNRIGEGDSIIQVNGYFGRGKEILAIMQQANILQLVLRRPKTEVKLPDTDPCLLASDVRCGHD